MAPGWGEGEQTNAFGKLKERKKKKKKQPISHLIKLGIVLSPHSATYTLSTSLTDRQVRHGTHFLCKLLEILMYEIDYEIIIPSLHSF